MILAIVEDNLFEKLSVEASKSFPLEFLEAIPVGVSLGNVYPLLFAWQLTDKEYGIINLLKNERDIEAITKLSELYAQLGIGEITVDQFRSAYLADNNYYNAMRVKLIELLKEAK